MGIVPLDDHPSVLLQLRGVEDLEQGLGHPLDQPRLEVLGQPALEQLHANERHLRGPCRLRHAFHCAGNEVPHQVLHLQRALLPASKRSDAPCRLLNDLNAERELRHP